MKKIEVPIEEQETIINYSKSIGEWCEIYTTDKVIMKRYLKFCKDHPECGKVIAEDQYSTTFSVDPRCAGMFPKAPRKVNLTETQKQVLRDRMKSMQKK